MSFDEDYATVNSDEFIRSIVPAGPGGERLHRPDTRIIRRFVLSPAQEAQGVQPGRIVVSDDGKQLIATWKKLRWKKADEANHYGWLHIVAPMMGTYYSWWIEKLRKGVEDEGTSSVNAAEWKYEDDAATPYEDFWAVIFDGKWDSPFKNRRRNLPLERPDTGDLCAFWVGGWIPGGSNARTDLFPMRYNGPGTSEGPGPGDGGGPGDFEPPGGPLSLTDADLDAIARKVTARMARLLNE